MKLRVNKLIFMPLPKDSATKKRRGDVKLDFPDMLSVLMKLIG